MFQIFCSQNSNVYSENQSSTQCSRDTVCEKVAQVALGLLLLGGISITILGALKYMPSYATYAGIGGSSFSFLSLIVLKCITCRKNGLPERIMENEPSEQTLTTNTSDIKEIVSNDKNNNESIDLLKLDPESLIEHLTDKKEIYLNDWPNLNKVLEQAFALGKTAHVNILIQLLWDPSFPQYEKSPNELTKNYFEVEHPFDLPPLHFAAAFGYLEGMRWLLSKPVNRYVVHGSQKLTFMYFAMLAGHHEIIELAMKHRFNFGDLEERYKLYYDTVANAPNEQTIQALIEPKFLRVFRKHKYYPLLIVAAQKKNTNGIAVLLRLGENPYRSIREEETWIPFYYYFTLDRDCEKTFFAEHRFSYYSEGEYSFNEWLSKFDPANEVEQLEQFSTLGEKYLYLAIKNDEIAIVTELVKLGLKPSRTLIEEAVQKGSPEILAFLLKHGEIPYKCAFTFNQQKKCVETLCLLLSVELSHVSKLAEEGISYAVQHNLNALIHPMWEMGFPLGSFNEQLPPLHVAAILRNKNAIEILCGLGGNHLAETIDGKSPLDRLIEDRALFLCLLEFYRWRGGFETSLIALFRYYNINFTNDDLLLPFTFLINNNLAHVIKPLHILESEIESEAFTAAFTKKRYDVVEELCLLIDWESDQEDILTEISRHADAQCAEMIMHLPLEIRNKIITSSDLLTKLSALEEWNSREIRNVNRFALAVAASVPEVRQSFRHWLGKLEGNSKVLVAAVWTKSMPKEELMHLLPISKVFFFECFKQASSEDKIFLAQERIYYFKTQENRKIYQEVFLWNYCFAEWLSVEKNEEAMEHQKFFQDVLKSMGLSYL